MQEIKIVRTESEKEEETKYTLIQPESRPQMPEPVSNGEVVFSFKHTEGGKQ